MATGTNNTSGRGRRTRQASAQENQSQMSQMSSDQLQTLVAAAAATAQTLANLTQMVNPNGVQIQGIGTQGGSQQTQGANDENDDGPDGDGTGGGRSRRGFASMDPQKQREIASKGGSASRGGNQGGNRAQSKDASRPGRPVDPDSMLSRAKEAYAQLSEKGKSRQEIIEHFQKVIGITKPNVANTYFHLAAGTRQQAAAQNPNGGRGRGRPRGSKNKTTAKRAA